MRFTPPILTSTTQIRIYRPPNTSPNARRPPLGLRFRLIGQPGLITESERTRLRDMPKTAFYAVHSGRQPGVYGTWAEAQAQVNGFAGAKFKKFPTEQAAREFVRSKDAARPYQSPDKTDRGAAKQERDKGRAHSPPTHAAADALPEELRTLARKGYRFSAGTPHRLVVYTDGSGLGNGKAGARAGLGVWWGDSGEARVQGLAERVPGPVQTNNRGEILSVIRAIETCPYPHLRLEVRTDSQYTISCVTTFLPKWLKSNFRLSKSSGGEKGLVKNTDLIKHLLVLLRQRDPCAGVRFRYVPGHEGWEGNEGADRLAKLGASMPARPDRTDWLDLDADADADADDAPAGKDPVDVDVELDALEEEFRLQ